MNKQRGTKVNKLYLYSTLLLMLIIPVLSIAIEWQYTQQVLSIALAGKWLVFWAIGVRLLTAGFKQVINPAFTAREIFHLQSADSQIIIRELGFANICFGLAGVLSIFMPEFRPAAAFTGGLYMGIAGVNHIIKKPAGANEVLAMVSDIFILLVMATYLFDYFVKS